LVQELRKTRKQRRGRTHYRGGDFDLYVRFAQRADARQRPRESTNVARYRVQPVPAAGEIDPRAPEACLAPSRCAGLSTSVAFVPA
jgi:hypothetical protein